MKAGRTTDIDELTARYTEDGLAPEAAGLDGLGEDMARALDRDADAWEADASEAAHEHGIAHWPREAWDGDAGDMLTHAKAARAYAANIRGAS